MRSLDYDQEHVDQFADYVIEGANKTLQYVMSVIAHPHTAITEHDRHRALEIIRYMHPDEAEIEYLFSQMTPDDFKVIKFIRTHARQSL